MYALLIISLIILFVFIALIINLLVNREKVKYGSSESDCVLIIPYRATGQPERKKQLNKLLSVLERWSKNNKVIVVEQTDNNSFNRGALLNAGVDYCLKNKLTKNINNTKFIFHDVDLIPDKLRLSEYCKEGTVHLASGWKRYDYPGFVGGIISINYRDFNRINGFPNCFWGWGGEDDELSMRMKNRKIKVVNAELGKITDEEKIDKPWVKISKLKEEGKICPNKKKLLSIYKYARKKKLKVDGINEVNKLYKLVNVDKINNNIFKVTVDLFKDVVQPIQSQSKIKLPNNLKTTKIFGIGLNKTGTSSLGRFFKYAGFNLFENSSAELLSEAINVDKNIHLQEKFDRIIKNYNIFEDWPWPLMYKYINKKYSKQYNLKFILTIRKSDDEWYTSIMKHAARTGPTEQRKIVYSDKITKEKYNSHNKEVKNYFVNKVLVLNSSLPDKEKSKKIAKFINYDKLSKMNYPIINKSKT